LLKALNVWDRAPWRDECGAWGISGERGSIHTWGDGKSWVPSLPNRACGNEIRCVAFLN
jgi:hypothetical protein